MSFNLSTPKVSIIMPCYNNEKYVVESINTLKTQHYQSWECIILNDGSVDNSEAIILSAIKENPKFKYFFQKNQGVSVARNNAILQSKGDFILCLDSGDLISPNFLEEMVTLIESDPSITVVTPTVHFFGRSNGVMNVVSYEMSTLLAENQFIITSLFRRKDFDKTAGFNINMKEGFEDWDFWITLLKNNGKVKCATKAIFKYRLLVLSRNSMISEEQEKRLRFQLWQNHKELYSEYFVDPRTYFEYKKFSGSIEYKVGSIIVKPIRKLKYWLWFNFGEKFYK